MLRRRWTFHLVTSAIAYRRWRALLLVCVLALASGLVTALGIVSASMQRRVAEEVRHYGANLVVIPETARFAVGSGGLDFGSVAEPAYLSAALAARLLASEPTSIVGSSAHLRGELRSAGRPLPVEGVEFATVRRLFPWWQLQGEWPEAGEVVVGRDLAAARGLRPGDRLTLGGGGRSLQVRVAGVVTSGGDEDKTCFMELAPLQRLLDLEGQLSELRVVAATGGEPLETLAKRLQAGAPGVQVREVRQVARTSEALLRKVQLLMLLVTLVVVIASTGSVAGTLATTVLERGREVGLLKAIGGSRRQVLLLFAAESLLLGLAGGAAGYLAGLAMATVITRSVFAAGVEFLPGMAGFSLAVGLLLALLGSAGPLLSVYRLEPVTSLRGE